MRSNGEVICVCYSTQLPEAAIRISASNVQASPSPLHTEREIINLFPDVLVSLPLEDKGKHFSFSVPTLHLQPAQRPCATHSAAFVKEGRSEWCGCLSPGGRGKACGQTPSDPAPGMQSLKRLWVIRSFTHHSLLPACLLNLFSLYSLDSALPFMGSLSHVSLYQTPGQNCPTSGPCSSSAMN